MAQHFDARNAPFDRLSDDEIDLVRSSLDIAYFRPNETIIARGGSFRIWGARKLLAVLREERPALPDWPAASTIGDILKRAGLVEAGGGGAADRAGRDGRGRRRPTRNGRSTSRAGSARATGSAAIR